MSLRNRAQELLELGARGTLFRVGWEVKMRAGLTSMNRRALHSPAPAGTGDWTYRLQLEDPVTLARALRPLISEQSLEQLRSWAESAVEGRVLCFGRWTADFGRPIDWHYNPVTGKRWDPAQPWSRPLMDDHAGDVKFTWEVARFPHAYHLARAAAYFPQHAERYAAALVEQVNSFTECNPYGRGIHWASGQETGFRLLAWLFALDVLLSRTEIGRRAEEQIASGLILGAHHIEERLDYAKFAVYNNHLLSEALALYACGTLIPETPEAARWRKIGRTVLDEEAERQFYHDGGYIQQSHNYHRVALQNYLWACSFARSAGDSPSDLWLRALNRSLDLLVAHQNPADGRLPNYGSNDGALPSALSTCDFSDMRPVLQAVSILVRGERLYPPGPWDESAGWFLGVRALDAPLVRPRQTSLSFDVTGYHVLRGRDASSFCTIRCGTLNDRFSQIDMLHTDVWWRGLNLLVDAGSFSYNGSEHWHNHFMRTGCHNTVMVDGRDQMVHFRQFKVLYWTKARTLRFEDTRDWALCLGEHYGYVRETGCVHRRVVLFLKDDVWIVVDRVAGSGRHAARIHWLCADHPYTELTGGLALHTSEGTFEVRLFGEEGSPMDATVVLGDEVEPRGWLSRYYGERLPVPSLAATRAFEGEITIVSVMQPAGGSVSVNGSSWMVGSGESRVLFELRDGDITDIEVERTQPSHAG